MQKIKSISEAYSMQPTTMTVVSQSRYGSYKINGHSGETLLKEIKLLSPFGIRRKKK